MKTRSRDKATRPRIGRRRFLYSAATLGAAVPLAGAGLSACYSGPDPIAGAPGPAANASGTAPAAPTGTPTLPPETPTPTGAPPTPSATPSASASPTASTGAPNVSFTLQTSLTDHGLMFVGVGGPIDGQMNPDLQVNSGDVVQVTLQDGDGVEHNIAFPDFGVSAPHLKAKGETTTVTFTADRDGQFVYYCELSGHRAAGMEGRLIVGASAPVATAPSVSRDPTDLPAPLAARGAQTVRLDLEAVDIEGQLADGVTYKYFTFNEKVPGPFLRVRVGDTVETHLKNRTGNAMTHSVDLHAVTGPGGGSTVTQVPPGEERVFTFKALVPGLFVYHCATPSVPEHIANGMYGLILVEPEGGLAKVDHEFYVMQGEIYTVAAYGEKGRQEFSRDKLSIERPEYFVFNGAVGSLTVEHPLKVNVGQSLRIYFGVGGPNFISSFHIIGEIFDRVYDLASLSAPLTGVQTTLVPPGGATIVELVADVPGNFLLVDHALSRSERGLVGFLQVEGAENPSIFHEGPAA